ncbi:MAG: CHAD domain-containing protein [Armatimonadetes bacterium]|nr:CHAD domain-containing protein [Armatimonadota bacterium]
MAEQSVMSHPPLFTPKDSFAEAGRRTLLLHFDRFLKHEAGTRLGKDIEELHDMRVASRRMRAAIRVFGRAIGKQRMQPYVEELRWIAGELGKVRDLDVFIAYLTGYKESLPEVDRPGVQPLIEERRSARRSARRSLLQAMKSDRFSLFKERLRVFLTEELPPRTTKRRGKLIRKEAPRALRGRFEAVCAFVPVLQSEPTPENYHALRIATKRFRYTAEFFREVYIVELEEIIRQCVSIQDALGEVHDVDVHKEYLNQTLANLPAGPDSEVGTALRQAILPLISAEADRRQEQQVKFDSLWKIWSQKAEQKRMGKVFGHVKLTGS